MKPTLLKAWQLAVRLLGATVASTVVLMVLNAIVVALGAGDPSLLKTMDNVSGGVGVLFLLAYLGFMIAVSRLFKALAVAFHAHNGNFVYTPGQALWALWIPFINLVRPWYLVAAILQYLENPEADHKTQRRLQALPGGLLLAALINWLVNRQYTKASVGSIFDESQRLQEAVGLASGGLVVGVVDLAFYALIFVVLRRIKTGIERFEWKHSEAAGVALPTSVGHSLSPVVETQPTPGTEEKPSIARTGRWMLVAVVVATVGVLLLAGVGRKDGTLQRALDEHVYVYFRPEHEQEFVEYGWRLLDMPGLKERFGDKGASEIAALSRELGRSGMRRVGTPDVLERSRIIKQWCGVADDRTCAGMYRGNVTGEQYQTAFNALPREERRAWFDLTMRGIAAELRGDPIISVSEADTTRAWQVLYASLQATEAQRLATILTTAETTDTDAAWAFRTIYQNIERLPEPHNLVLARVLVSY